MERTISALVARFIIQAGRRVSAADERSTEARYRRRQSDHFNARGSRHGKPPYLAGDVESADVKITTVGPWPLPKKRIAMRAHILVALAVLLAPGVPAFAQITDAATSSPRTACAQQCSPTLGEGPPASSGDLRLVGQTLDDAAGFALEQLIIALHDSALIGATPIPGPVRQRLSGYASENSMNRVRYKIDDSGLLNLTQVLESGGIAAVTLIDVVIFRGPSEANDPSIWAHELTHVDQYMAWGLHGFAVQYARDPNSVEKPAYAKGNGYWAWARQHSR